MTGFPLLMPAAGIIVALLGTAVLLHARRNRKPAWPGLLGILLGALLILLSLFRPEPPPAAPTPATQPESPRTAEPPAAPSAEPEKPETPQLPSAEPETRPPAVQPENPQHPEIPEKTAKPEIPAPAIPPEKPAEPVPSTPPVSPAKREKPVPPATAGSAPHREEKPANATSLPATLIPR